MPEATRGAESVVSLTLEARGGQTEVTLLYSGVPDDELGVSSIGRAVRGSSRRSLKGFPTQRSASQVARRERSKLGSKRDSSGIIAALLRYYGYNNVDNKLRS